MSWALAYLGTLAFAAFVLWLYRRLDINQHIDHVAALVRDLYGRVDALEKHTHDGLLKPEERNLLENLAIEAGLKSRRGGSTRT